MHVSKEAALHHGAPAKEIDLLALYAKLEDPEQCKYALFYPEEATGLSSGASQSPVGGEPPGTFIIRGGILYLYPRRS